MMPNPSAFTNLSLLSHFADRDCATHISLPCSYNFEAAVVDPSKVMKQELQSRARVVSRSTKDSPRAEADKVSPPMLKPRPKPTDVYTNSSTSLNSTKRSLHFNKLRPGTNKGKELESRLDESARMVVELHKEVAGLKAEVDELKVRNVELESENKRLHQHLVAAEAKNVNKVELDSKSKFREALDLVQPKLVSKKATELEIHGSNTCKNHSLSQVQPKLVNKMPIPPSSTSKAPPPPPPPPPPPHNDLGRIAVSKPSALVQLYHSLNKRDGKQGSLSNGCSSSLSSNVHSGIVGELQHRSAHLLAIKADVETKGQLIKHLIEKVQSSSFSNMADVLSFVDWLDGQLSTLADERAVLKHFDWPEKKADALREAAVEFRDLKQLEAQVSSLKDDPSLPCETTLKKISNLLDKLERGVGRVIKLRNSNMVLYRECKIPTDWLLDSGMVCKMKQLSVKLARCYLSRVSIELESFRESAQEALLFQGVRFAYRAHQFAGGLDSELMITIEELKKKVELQGTTK